MQRKSLWLYCTGDGITACRSPRPFSRENEQCANSRAELAASLSAKFASECTFFDVT
jgi:hypothetical protein